ncbi:calcium uniporter protein 2, mitochondrial-like [Sesamum indicum]|uniref:Calcium uniporter protein 2, mitochondrial-like n=1 Tax=Sesamum indicum TaxID=4182 RepID=A0A6I9UM65_SESIN|nr:calcium uniporter protein 2, mitochondrial-like [Sesamum indicum]
MAFKKTLAQRLFGISRISNRALTNCRVSSPCTAVQSKALNHKTTTPNRLAPDPGDDGIFRRYLHRFSAATSPGLRFLPTGENLFEKLREMDIARDRIRLDGLRPAAPEVTLSLKDAVKILRLSQLETVKSRLRQIEKDCVSYPEFLEICAKECSSVDQAEALAKMLDESGSVIVLGNIVFLRPEQVVKAIQGLIPIPSQTGPEDQIKELQELERQKAAIDRRAELKVRRELWCGLGCLAVQTAAFMRLTFWELSWDVMEPICFYVTSLYFMGGYAFFLRTSKEPSFEGFFQSRFSAKQKRLMKAQNFDVGRYNELKKLACSGPQSPGINSISLASSGLRTY